MTALQPTSPSPSLRNARSQPWPGWPTIVAESLAGVAAPVATVLATGPAAGPRGVVAALASSLAPPRLPAAAPPWLWPSQHVALERALAGIARYGGALLADPVGTGKTYVALAVASALNGSGPTVCLVPAALREQWTEAAGRTGVPIVTCSHERASRGRLPAHTGRLVLIDESHRLRNPATRAYGHAASWLLGRHALLLSATPVVNRLTDLAHQLRLAVRDDALAPHGVASVTRLLEAGHGHPALGLLVLTGPAVPAARPGITERIERLDQPDEDLERLLGEMDRLAFSPEPAAAALIRCMLWRSAGSSPAALGAGLRRYRRLLLHARDAERAGLRPGRHSLQRLTGGLGDQLLMWELLPGTDGPLDLIIDDLPLLDALVLRATASAERDDVKLTRLRAILADGRATLVFSVSRHTVRWLRDRLGPRIAWCTGERAGIGPLRVPRRAAFAWFRADGPRRRGCAEGRFAPLHLVSTDVAAEGLDLQGAGRVVHYDLPWTPMRLDQRRGRVVRAGSPHLDVEVVRFELPAALEDRLQHAGLLARKACLPGVLGLGEAGAEWRWLSELGATYHGTPGERGVAAVAAGPAGVLAGFTLHAWPDDGLPPAAAHLLWWSEQSGWSDDPETLVERLEVASASPAALAPTGAARSALERIGDAVRERLRAVRRAAWDSPPPGPAARACLAGLDRLARTAARRRDPDALIQVQRAIRFAAGGHTAGEALEVERLARLRGPDLAAAMAWLPRPTSVPSALQARVTGVILFLGATTFPRCHRSTPFCSTSTAP